MAAGLTWGLRGAGLQVAGLFAHRLHQRVAAPDDVLPLVALHIPHPHSDAAGFRALGKREGEVRQDPAVAGVCAKPGSAQKKLCSMEMSGKGGKLFPLAECHVSAPHRWPLAPSLLPAPSAARSSLRPGIRGCAPIPCRCDPPSSSHCPSQRAANELAQSVRCSVAPGWLQPPRGCGTPPPPSTPGVGLRRQRLRASCHGFAEPLLGPVLGACCPLDASSGWDYGRAALANYRLQ